MIDLADITSLAAGMPATYHRVSDVSRLLALALLTQAGDRWQWRNDGAKLTDAQWDTAQALIDGAVEEFLQPMLTGMILLWTNDTIPTGFLLCNGAAVSRTDYAALFGALGTIYGEGDGLLTFNLPNLTARFALGGGGGYGLADTGGEVQHTLTANEMPAHDHSYHRAWDVPVTFGEIPGTAAVSMGATTGSAGGGQAHNNMPPYQVINYIIKT